ncbi:MAG: hypothetical protein E6G56_09615 [Actinobacteria bacterium]|nr:MAG: hypothetical protein E6G56_09615 [Actinomycetota bacterium]
MARTRTAVERADPLPLVLIHLGSRPPRFLFKCAKQATAVSHRQPHVVGPRVGARYDSPKLRRFRASQGLSKLGLKGFWRYACERFFVLEEHMARTGVERCLHIESDVLVYLSPNEYDDWLASAYGDAVAVCPLTADEDTAAVFFVGSRKALAKFNDALLELVELGPEGLLETHGGPMANDMRMLFLLRAAGLARALPTTIEEGEALDSPCLFDPASYGQWLGGTHADPGVPFAGDHHAIGREFIGRRYELFWDGQRRIPLLRRTGSDDTGFWRLANLHIHSKRLGMWSWTEPDRAPRVILPPSLAPRAVAGRAGQRLRQVLR